MPAVRRRAGAAGAILALLAASAGLTAASAGSPRPASLGSILADPPSGFVVQADGGNPARESGPRSIDQLSASSGDPAATRRLLAGDHFTRAYWGSWSREGGLVLVEAAVEFRTGSDAASFAGYLKQQSRRAQGFRDFFDVAGLASAYGVHYGSLEGISSDQVYLTKGNLILEVALGGYEDAPPDLLLAQVHRQYALAPEHTIPARVAVEPPPTLLSGRARNLLGASILLLVAAAAVAVAVHLRRSAQVG